MTTGAGPFDDLPVVPYRIETLFQHEPWANKALFGLTIACSLALESGMLPDETVQAYFVWGEGNPLALFGYLFAHGGIGHLFGNMVFLWVFGNAVCATVGNWTYLALYLGMGSFAGLVHLLADGTPVVGASGAIAGVVGMAVAFYPLNRVNLFYWLGMIPRTGRLWLWAIALYWTAWDIFGAVFALGPVAYWAHLGGTAAGLAVGLLLLATGRARLTEFDHGSLLDFMLRREPPHHDHAAETFAEIERRRALLQANQPEFASAETAPQPTAQAAPTGENRIQVHPELPDVPYHVFDRRERRGPMSRATFLTLLASAPETDGWWYWGVGMAEWQPVEDLAARKTATSKLRLKTRPAGQAVQDR